MEKREGDSAAAFLRYARHGLHRRRLSPLHMADHVRGCLGTGPEAERMMAVYDTLRLLRCLGAEEAIAAVEAVYFADAGRRLRRNDVTLRVRRFAAEHYWDDRSVYRRLAQVKRLFARILNDGKE